MLGWEQEPIEAAQQHQTHIRRDQAFVLLARGSRHMAASAAVLGIVTAVLCFFLGIPGAFLPLVLASPALVLWLRNAIG
jgi:hypothetical protein